MSALAVPALAGGAPPTPSAPAASKQRVEQSAALTASQSGSQDITLVTGERVRLMPAPDGRSMVTVAPDSTASGPRVPGLVETFEINGDVYAVPAYALPFLGSRLDPRLFDVSYLQRAGYAGLKALPVSVTWQQATHAEVPGLRTPSGGTRTAGSVQSASQFGQALREAFAAAVQRRAQARAGAAVSAVSGPLAQIKKVSLGPAPAGAAGGAASAEAEAAGQAAGVPPSAAGGNVAPAVPLSGRSARRGTKVYPLTVRPVGRTGSPPLVALIFIQNLDHFQRYYSFYASGWPISAAAAPETVSVPAGRYAVEAMMIDADPDLNVSYSFADVPQVSVSGDKSVTVDARRAKPVSVTVPRPAETAMADMMFTRLSADGQGMQSSMFWPGPGMFSSESSLRLYAQPTAAPRTGSLDFADSWELVPPGSGAPGGSSGDVAYAYSLDFASPHGVPVQLSHVVTDRDLAVVHEGFAGSAAGANMLYWAAPFHPWSSLQLMGLSPTDMGYPVSTRRTDYFGGSAKTVWEQVTQAGSQLKVFPIEPNIFGPYRTFHPGERLSMTWGASPSVPAPEWQRRGLPATGLPVYEGGDAFQRNVDPRWSFACPVCRQGDLMSFDVPMSGDNDPTHSEAWTGYVSPFYLHSPQWGDNLVKFYRNGVLGQMQSDSGEMFPMLAGKARYRIEWSHDVPTPGDQLAASTDTVWSFTSRRPVSASRLPSYELCSPDVRFRCSFVPLVFASYRFGADLAGQVVAPGTHTFTVTGYHEQGVTGLPVNRASAQVSFDDGKTWSAASSVTSLGHGRFQVSVTDPDPSATSGFVSVRVTLTDSAGDSLRQTIIRAYALTSTAAAAAGQGNGSK